MGSGVSEHEPGGSGPFAGAAAVLNCPAHLPFLKTLASSILDGSIWNAGAPQPHDLPGLTIYLPSQAAVQPLKLEFVWASPNQATFLPRIRVLGEADPLDLFSIYGTRMKPASAAVALLKKALAIPPAFTELERQIQLSALAMEAAAKIHSTIAEPGERLFPDVPPVSAAAIAREIGALIDEAHNEAADLALIDRLDSSESSRSEQLSRQLLRAVRKGWAAHKLRVCKLDAQERRNRLMAIEADFIRQSHAPVIVAGSTGSVAATMALMETLKGRPNAAIVLHGLDRTLDAEAWSALNDHPEHPQHGLHRLLARLGLSREAVRDLGSPLCAGEPEKLRRIAFLSEALRPASTTAKWASFAVTAKNSGRDPAPGLALIEADTKEEEAAAIALILRESLEEKGRTAALVTPDETLMARVRHALTHWGLAMALEEPAPDVLALRAAFTAASAKPEDPAALMRSAAGEEAAAARRCAELIDLGVLRQMWRPSAMLGIPAALSRAEHAIASGEARHPAMKRIEAAEWEAARAFTERVLDALAPLANKTAERLKLAEWTAAHSAVMARLSELGLGSPPSEDGEPSTLEEAAKVAAPLLRLDLAGYAGFFGEISAARARAGKDNPHPRLFLRTPLDARLFGADVVVLGGLNEGCWPHLSGPSPWLNRADRVYVGLSPEERRIGLAARDFAMLAAVAPRVILTRARKVNGSLTRPSRWVARLKALADGTGHAEALQDQTPWLSWARLKRAPARVVLAEQPAPRPPVAARPRRLSVTAIETWFANPYAIYARHILELEPLRRIGETHDARDKGVLYHAALHRFFQRHPGPLPPDAAGDLVRCLDIAAEELGFNLENAPFWRPRFARFAGWFTSTEASRRADEIAVKSEVGGKLKFDAPAGPFEVTARADRIDVRQDGSVCIYDFKTSASAAKTSVARDAPQLSLEGLLLKEGAFAGIAPGCDPDLFYIVATGGEPPGDVIRVTKPCEAIQAAKTALLFRIARFDDPETPYAYESHAIFRDKAEHDPYAHLARLKEWSAGGQEGEAGDERAIL